MLGKTEANKLVKRLKTHSGSVITADDIVVVHIATSVSSKTSSRYIAEKSLISSMALIILVVCTHFIVVEKQDQEIRKILNQTPNDGVKLMYRLVSKCNKNLPVVSSPPEHIIYSTNYSTTYCYGGKGEKTSSFVLVGSNTMTKAGSCS